MSSNIKTPEDYAQHWLFQQDFFIEYTIVPVSKIDAVNIGELPHILAAFHKQALEEKIKEISKFFYGLNPSIEMLNDKQRHYDYGLGKAIEILKQ